MIDFHAHSHMSYCADDDLHPSFYLDFIQSPDNKELEKLVIADHGMALYFPEEIAWEWNFISDSRIFDQWRDWGNERLHRHLDVIKDLGSENIMPGFEVEMMHDGRFTMDPAFRDSFDILVGAVHYLPVSAKNGFSKDEIIKYWKDHTLRLLDSDIDILAHPFRWLSNNVEIPPCLVKEIVEAARNSGKVLEINSHFKINTDIQMLRECVSNDVTVSFGTDTHSKKQAGDFSYHREIVAAAGLEFSEIKFLRI